MKVRKRDGRVEEFDPSKLAAAIGKAALATGYGEDLLAEELSSVVTLFLEKRFSSCVAPVQDIQEMVETVLMDTGHGDVARAFLLFRERRERLKEVIQVRESMPRRSDQGAVEVDSRVGETISPWSKGRIIEALMTEAELSGELASEIAQEVEARIFQSGLLRVSTSLIRELVDNELFNRGLSGRLLNQAILGVPGYDLKRIVEADGEAGIPANVTARVGDAVLRQYSLRWIYAPEEAEAHLRGHLVIEGLRHPSGYLGMEVEPTLLPAPFGGSSSTPGHLAACLNFLGRFTAQPVRVSVTNAALLAWSSQGIEPEIYAENLLLALARAPVNLQDRVSMPLLSLDRYLHDPRERLLRNAGIQGRAAYKFMDRVATAFLDASVRLGRELAVSSVHLNLSGHYAPERSMLSKAVLLEGSGRLILAAVPLRPEPLAAVTPLIGGADVTLESFLNRNGPLPEEALLAEARSMSAMAMATLYSKDLFMRKLHGKGRGPESAIRRFLGGNGDIVGPRCCRIVPSALLRLRGRIDGELEREFDGISDSPKGMERMIENLLKCFKEWTEGEGGNTGLFVRLDPAWAGTQGQRLLPAPENVESAVQAALSWNRAVPLDPLPDFFCGDGKERIAFLQTILDRTALRDHVS